MYPNTKGLFGLTAVHEASAGLAVLVWLHIDTHTDTHTNTVSTGSSESETAHSGYMGHGRQNSMWY